MSALFSKYRLGSLELRNRIVIAPMCQYSADEGRATDWHTIHLGNLALSGAALLVIEATAVLPEGRISPDDLGLWSDDTEESLGRMVGIVRRYSDMLPRGRQGPIPLSPRVDLPHQPSLQGRHDQGAGHRRGDVGLGHAAAARHGAGHRPRGARSRGRRPCHPHPPNHTRLTPT